MAAGAAIVAGAMAGFAAGCGGGENYACSQNIVHGIRVSVTDAQTGANLAASSGIVATLIDDGNYTETLQPSGFALDGTTLSLGGADERRGTYHLQIRVPGYVTYDRSNLTVTKGDCHVNTVTIAAALTPL